MKILLIGADGQVGSELVKALRNNHQLVTTTLDSPSSDYRLNLTDLTKIEELILQVSPEVIINAAAYTAVDKAESESELAHTINAAAVAVMGDCAQRLEIPIVHYSTDYVFDGEHSEPKKEEESTHPINKYGESKLAGEKALLETGCLAFIFRTSWVYSSHGHNFVKTMLRLGRDRDELRVVADQFGTPTSARLLATITSELIDKTFIQPLTDLKKLVGVYHLTSSGETNWADFARYIFSEAGNINPSYKNIAIHSITSEEYPVPAKRPSYSTLDCRRVKETFNINHLPHWQEETQKVIKELLP